jgi:dTMP kinase
VTASGRGRLIAFEGIDGCGKSTQARLLATSLDAELTFEPGATPLGAALRRLLLDPGQPSLGLRAEALLMAADRAQHVEESIEPALSAGRWVVTDRYSGSTLAYQGWGRGLDVDALSSVVGWATAGLAADLSVLVDLEPEAARHRLASTSHDRLERLDPAFHARVHDGFLQQAKADPDHWVVIDGAAPIEQVAVAVSAAVRARLGVPGAAASEAAS